MSRSRSRMFAAALAAMAGAALLLGGCQSTGERMMARAKREDSCGARKVRAFVGLKADQATRDAIEQRVADPRRIRWIVPGEDILADLMVSRLNIRLSEDGTILGMGCY